LRVLGIKGSPRVLLSHVQELQLVDLIHDDECCGFGGMFALKNADTSVAMGQDKLAQINDTGAEVVCALDNSCLTHIGGVASRLRSPLRMMHLAEILAARE
jgi:L-lactate dehydrogenase complex protein LldE